MGGARNVVKPVHASSNYFQFDRNDARFIYVIRKKTFKCCADITYIKLVIGHN
jgi:hypothetical protein